MSVTYQGHGWVRDGSEWYPDHDTHLTEVWAPSKFTVQELKARLEWFDSYRHYDHTGQLSGLAGMLGAKWDSDYSEWTWPENLTFSQG